MPVRLYAYTCGMMTMPFDLLLGGAEGLITIPVPAYLIVHPKGRALFDTGIHADCQDDAEGHLGAPTLRTFSFDYAPGAEIAARLAATGTAVEDIDLIINSHLHFDHCGGNAQLPNADILLQARELAHARAMSGEGRGYYATEFDTGQRLRTVEGEHDVFGDGDVVCLPTYGHTPGHQSLLVRTELGGEFLLCGDACYLKDSLDRMQVPGRAADPEAMLDVFRRLRAMAAQGARLMYGHDPGFWSEIPQAPVRLG